MFKIQELGCLSVKCWLLVVICLFLAITGHTLRLEIHPDRAFNLWPEVYFITTVVLTSAFLWLNDCAVVSDTLCCKSGGPILTSIFARDCRHLVIYLKSSFMWFWLELHRRPYEATRCLFVHF
jgi:hypothetical protein